MCNFQLIRSNKCKKFCRSDFKSLLNRNERWIRTVWRRFDEEGAKIFRASGFQRNSFEYSDAVIFLVSIEASRVPIGSFDQSFLTDKSHGSLSLPLPPSLSSFFPHSSFLPTPARLSTCFVGRADESSKRKGFSLCNVTDTPCIRPENRKPIPRSHLIPWNGDAEKSNRLDVLFLAKKPSKAEIDSMLFRPASSRLRPFHLHIVDIYRISLKPWNVSEINNSLPNFFSEVLLDRNEYFYAIIGLFVRN